MTFAMPCPKRWCAAPVPMHGFRLNLIANWLTARNHIVHFIGGAGIGGISIFPHGKGSAMHRMSFEVQKSQPVPRKDLYWPALILFAMVVCLAWSLEPVLAKLINP